MRSKLFLSYSRADSAWRDRFLRHLKTLFHVGTELWVDRESLEGGEQWLDELKRGAGDSKCALLLVTPNYLEKGRFARDELDLLLEEYARGLKILPVLVEQCSWQSESALADLQFVRWENGTIRRPEGNGEREQMRALADIADEPDIDRAIIDVCETIRRVLGTAADTTPKQRDELLHTTQDALGQAVHLDEAVYSGEFSVVYRARMGGRTVAVKAIPDAARQNRARAVYEAAIQSISELRDPAFIKVHYAVLDREPQCVVMEYVDWPTLDAALARHPGRRLAPRDAAAVLAAIARAQRDAHRAGVQLGPLSSASIHVNNAWDVRMSPFRIKGHLARTAELIPGQLVDWDMLATLTPELWAGHQPTTRDELDRHEQYYLGLFGLELLLGRRPFEIRRFEDLGIKSAFFENARAFFDDGGAKGTKWTEDCPALAVILDRLLARDPLDRLQPNEADAAEQLQAVLEGMLPSCVRRQLELDLEGLSADTFGTAFYSRLFELRPSLRERFQAPHAQPRVLVDALQDLAAFRPYAMRSRFLRIAQKHAAYGIAREDVDAFRLVFLEEVSRACGGRQRSRDAWAAALEMGLSVIMTFVSGATLEHQR